MMTLATLWFSPVVWSYHFVAATPVLAILFLRGPLPLAVGRAGRRGVGRERLACWPSMWPVPRACSCG